MRLGGPDGLQGTGGSDEEGGWQTLATVGRPASPLGLSSSSSHLPGALLAATKGREANTVVPAGLFGQPCAAINAMEPKLPRPVGKPSGPARGGYINPPVPELHPYRVIMDDVLRRSRELFIEEGIDESILVQLTYVRPRSCPLIRPCPCLSWRVFVSALGA